MVRALATRRIDIDAADDLAGAYWLICAPVHSYWNSGKGFAAIVGKVEKAWAGILPHV
jgi:hypothetical protein